MKRCPKCPDVFIFNPAPILIKESGWYGEEYIEYEICPKCKYIDKLGNELFKIREVEKIKGGI